MKSYWQKKNNNNYASHNTCTKCHKFGHQRKNCKTQVHSKNQTKDKGKGNVDIEKVWNEMN